MYGHRLKGSNDHDAAPKALIAALAVAAALAVGVPAASASTVPPIGRSSLPAGFERFQWNPLGAVSVPVGLGNASPLGACGSASPHAQGSVGEVANQVCLGAGLSFIGPATGQIATVIGPTIMSPGFVGNVIVSAGNVAVVP